MTVTTTSNGDLGRRPLVSVAVARACLSGHLALVLDDDVSSFGHIFVSLASAGCRAVLARRWTQAVHQIERVGRPSLLIFSTTLKDMEAAEVIEAVRAIPATNGAILVALAERDSKREQRLLRSLGCDGYICKPADRFLFAAELVRRAPRLTAGSGAPLAAGRTPVEPWVGDGAPARVGGP